MAKTLKSALSATAGARALGMVRPSVEALLLAAVALGCAQAGWSILAPSDAGALNAPTLDDSESSTLDRGAVQSPFAPLATEGSHAIDALLSTMQLAGVRMATDDGRSGAFLTLADGAQRAYLVGQEVAPGVTLEAVGADSVVLAYDGGQRQLQMSAGPSFSFARAMMGLEPAPGAPPFAAAEQQVTQQAAQQAQETTVAEASPAAAMRAAGANGSAWLGALQPAQSANGRAGLRISGALPEAARTAGLMDGDIIVAINGASPQDAANLMAAAQRESLQLSVERQGQLVQITVASGRGV